MPSRTPSAARKREHASRRQQTSQTAKSRPQPAEKHGTGGGGDNRYFSRAVAKSLKVLEILQSSGSAMSLNEIAERIELSKTSAFRLLRTLETSGYLVSMGAGKFQIASELHSVVPALWVGRLLRAAWPHIQELNRTLLETVSMAVLFENRIEVVAVVESPQSIRMSNVVGHILPPNASSLGKAITAFQNEHRREKLLRSYGFWHFTERSITDRSKLEEEFLRVRADRFATDREETVAGGICFGVPIFNSAGKVTMGLSASFPTMRVRDDGHEKAIIAALRAASANISRDFAASQKAS